MAEGPQNTTVQDGKNSTIHDTNNKSTTQGGTKILQRNLAWQRYNDWKVNSWHPWQGSSEQEQYEDSSCQTSTASNYWILSTCIHGICQHQHWQFQHNCFYQLTTPQADKQLAHKLTLHWKTQAHRQYKRHHWHYQHEQCTISQWIRQWQHHHWRLHQQQWQDHHCQHHQQASDNTRSLQVKRNPNNQGQHSPRQQQAEDKRKNNQKQR